VLLAKKVRWPQSRVDRAAASSENEPVTNG